MLAAGANADDRFPVRLTDDTSQSLESRVAAIDAVLGPLSNRLERIGVSPSPIDPQLLSALVGLEGQAYSLAKDANCFAAGVPIGTELGVTTVVDDDVFASDTSSGGLANQASTIATILNIADGRLIRISTDWFQANPATPPSPIIGGLAIVEADSYALAVGAATIGGFATPPSPVCPVT
jgi:hypothetical protein